MVETLAPDEMESSVIAVARTASRGSTNSSLIRAVNAEEPEFSIASETAAPAFCNENLVADSLTRRLGLVAENLAAKIKAEKRHTNIKPIKRRRIKTTSCFSVVRFSQHQPEVAEALGRAAARLTMNVCDQ
jgi:ABC-type molybdenum transport system ATPase subunit/photorepair protein PhrA